MTTTGRQDASVLELTAIVLEARSCLGNAGINATTAEVIDLVRLVALREAESRRPRRAPARIRGSNTTSR